MASTIDQKILKLYKEVNVALLSLDEIDKEIRRLRLTGKKYKDFNFFGVLNHFALKIQANAYNRGYKQATDDLKATYDGVEKENSSLIKQITRLKKLGRK